MKEEEQWREEEEEAASAGTGEAASGGRQMGGCWWILWAWLLASNWWLSAAAKQPATERPGKLVLENGATAYVSSLEDYLASSSESPAREQLEREGQAQRAAQVRQVAPTDISKLASSNLSQQASKPIPQHWQVKSLLNVTHDYPLAYSQIICGYIWPLMANITLFTNLMIVFVLTQRDMRTPTNVVLTAIAIADIIPIVVPVPWFVYLFAMGNEKQVLYPPLVCYFYQHSTRSISEIFYFLSTWLNVLLAVQDYLTASWPRLAEKYCQIKVVVIEIVSLTLLAFLLNLPQALKLVFKPVRFYYQGQLTWGCKALQAKWFKDLVGEYVAIYDDIFTAIIVLFVDGGPALALITLTALLIRQLQKQRIQGHLLMEQARTASKRRRVRHRQQEYEASARVMIFVLLAFLAVKIPFATTYTLMIVQSRFEIHFVDELVDFQRAITLIDLVFVLSYPINFTIFCCCSKKFRHKCAQLISERFVRHHLRKSSAGQLSLENSSADGDTLAGSLRRHSRPVATTLAQANHHAHHSQQDRKRASLVSLAELEPSNQRRLAELAPELRRLVEEGELCLECVWHYEQIKSGRRVSADSTPSWPASLPPPLAPLYLPSIITTRCESIREQSSLRSSSADLDSVLAARAEPHPPEAGWTDEGAGLRSPRSAGEPSRLARPQARSASGSSARMASDPGTSFLGARQLESLLRRLSGGGPERRPAEGERLGVAGGRAPGLGQLTSNRRSLSLSNSKLSTLPNATGLLADVLMSTLLAEPDLARGSKTR